MVHALRADGAALPPRRSNSFAFVTYFVQSGTRFDAAGYRVVLVSSGAIGVGCQRLKLSERPKGLAQKQALAAIGQVYLMRYYEDFFDALGLVSLDNDKHRDNQAFVLSTIFRAVINQALPATLADRPESAVQPCAQVLLTLDNLANRNQYLNARNTFDELFSYGAVPVVNENDTVAVEELLARFGDNDTLSAQVSMHADLPLCVSSTDAPQDMLILLCLHDLIKSSDC